MARMDNGADYEIFKHEITNKPDRSTFNLSYLHTFTADFGELRPIYLEETIPSDKFSISNNILIRTQPMQVPIMSNIRIYTHYFYCRNNALWKGWNDFCSKGMNGAADENYQSILPKWSIDTELNRQLLGEDGKHYGLFTKDSIANALGLPILQKYGETGLESPSETSNIKSNRSEKTQAEISLLPFFMYQKIYRDYYMNRNLNQDDRKWYPLEEYEFILNANQETWGFLPTTNAAEQRVSGESNVFKEEYSLFTKRYRNWRDDYFTAAMPWPQRGQAPTINLNKSDALQIPVKAKPDNSNPAQEMWGSPNADGSPTITHWVSEKGTTAYHPWSNGYTNHLIVETSDMDIQITMEQLRQLTSMQEWQERNARAKNTGNYYNAMMKSHFNFDPKYFDNSPVFIGGTVQDIVVTEVLQTSATNETQGNALGESAGHGISAASGNVGEFTAPDYGYIMGIMSIVPDVTYADGIDTMWTRTTFADIYYPEFNKLGAQAIKNKELYVNGDQEENDNVWAYQERFADYKHRRNRVSGDMANSNDAYFSAWTMARFFESRPTFSQSFVSTKNNVSKRSFTFETEQPFTVQVANIVRATRPMPYLSTPSGLI